MSRARRKGAASSRSRLGGSLGGESNPERMTWHWGRGDAGGCGPEAAVGHARRRWRDPTTANSHAARCSPSSQSSLARRLPPSSQRGSLAHPLAASARTPTSSYPPHTRPRRARRDPLDRAAQTAHRLTRRTGWPIRPLHQRQRAMAGTPRRLLRGRPARPAVASTAASTGDRLRPPRRPPRRVPQGIPNTPPRPPHPPCPLLRTTPTTTPTHLSRWTPTRASQRSRTTSRARPTKRTRWPGSTAPYSAS